ncbi:MAG TPA: putative PEP-binding protein, partial [Nitrososphaerales archaeon]|nr:putative PEP-binding protein [Nitrososphaerales archaeon]
DKKGVGRLMKIATEDGRLENPRLEVGVCGETGGDPESIEFFINEVGVNYTSCSPYRVPIARLASAQATIKRRSAEDTKAKYTTV